jgi:hypothetical protein
MIRALVLAAAAVALTAPAFAEDAATANTETDAAIRAQLAFESQALQARQHLVRQGYVNVSMLEKDMNGLWTGTALKDGKLVIVAIKLPVAVPAPVTN